METAFQSTGAHGSVDLPSFTKQILLQTGTELAQQAAGEQDRWSLISLISVFWLRHLISFSCLGRDVPTRVQDPTRWVPPLWRLLYCQKNDSAWLVCTALESTRIEMLVMGIGLLWDKRYYVLQKEYNQNKQLLFTIETLALKYKANELQWSLEAKISKKIT